MSTLAKPVGPALAGSTVTVTDECEYAAHGDRIYALRADGWDWPVGYTCERGLPSLVSHVTDFRLLLERFEDATAHICKRCGEPSWHITRHAVEKHGDTDVEVWPVLPGKQRPDWFADDWI